MKFLAVILTSLILSLGSIPCCLSDICEDDKNQEQRHDNQENDCESCSYFLNCGFNNTIIHSQEISVPELSNINYLSSEIKTNPDLLHQEYTSVVWQPPRMK